MRAAERIFEVRNTTYRVGTAADMLGLLLIAKLILCRRIGQEKTIEEEKPVILTYYIVLINVTKIHVRVTLACSL